MNGEPVVAETHREFASRATRFGLEGLYECMQ